MQAKRIALPLLMTGAIAATAQEQQKPNIIILNIDDMGYSDPSCFGGTYTPTPDIRPAGRRGVEVHTVLHLMPHKLAVAHRPHHRHVPHTLGHHHLPAGPCRKCRQRAERLSVESRSIHGKGDEERGGYTTGHFGKWRMGGGRDVVNPPSITQSRFR